MKATETRPNRLFIRVSDAEKQEYQQAAKRAGTTVSDYARKCLKRLAKRHKGGD